jgi:NADH-quinone oxidoreductase subunit B
MLVASAVLGPRRSTPVKEMPYESGMDPIGDARQRFDVRYYLVAIVFLLFDVELLFLYPWAVAQWSVPAPAAMAAAVPANASATGPAMAVAGIPPVFRNLVFGEILVFGSILTQRGSGAVDVPENTILTTIDSVVNYCRKYSLWPMPFATACCGIELMAVGASRFDIARFGAEVMRFSPRQCDLMIVAGRVVMKMMPVLQRIWLQMPEPKWCISMGACASTGGVFDTYAVVQGVDRFMPVDVYIPGCPPRPEQILRAILDMQDKIQRGGSLAGTGLPELAEREKMLVEKQVMPPGFALAAERGDEDRFGYRLPGGPGLLGDDETK